MSRKTGLALCLAIAFGVIAGYVDLSASEMQAIVGTLLVLSFVMGLVAPQRAWRWALIIGCAIPIAELIALVIGIAPAGYAHSSAVNPSGTTGSSLANLPLTLFALIPAFMGVYVGVVFATLMRQNGQTPHAHA